jgi:hypothetical protein
MKKINNLKGPKVENKPSKPKNGIFASKSVWKFYKWSRKRYIFGGQKSENKPSEPKNEIWAPKSVWSCDTSLRAKTPFLGFQSSFLPF